MHHDDVMSVLNDPLAQELLHSPLLARLAYIGTDGAPRAIPIGYHWNGDQFVMCTAAAAPKVRALRANPSVALTVDRETMPPHVLLVRGTSSIDIVDGVPDEFLLASRKGLPAEDMAGFEAQTRSLYPRMARIAIEPTWAKLLDFETRLPVAVQHLLDQRG